MTLKDFFTLHPKAALAYSGGTDSAFLLYEALSLGADVKPYLVRSCFQPEFEFRNALDLSRKLGTEPEIILADVLSDAVICSNPANRCYYCKSVIFSAIAEKAAEDGYNVLIDGTNASDNLNERPGAKALSELGVLSPLRESGLTKPEIRRLSHEAGLNTWNRPAYSCLATRVKTGETITRERLEAVEKSEEFLFSLGFTDLRVRTSSDTAKLQFPAEQLPAAFEKLDEIKIELSRYFREISIDPEGRKTSL